MKEKGRDGDQGIKPSPGLIHRLRDEIRRKAALKNFLIFKGIVPLRERHRAGIKPAVDDLRHSVHFAATVFAGNGDSINVRPMQLDILRTIFR